jgi:hypothetical protein
METCLVMSRGKGLNIVEIINARNIAIRNEGKYEKNKKPTRN